MNPQRVEYAASIGAFCQLKHNLPAINIVSVNIVCRNLQVASCMENSTANVANLCHFRCRLSVICSTWKWYMISALCVS